MMLNAVQRSAWFRLTIAVLTVALAAAVRAALLGSLGARVPFITFYPAVVFAAFAGGLPGGLLATALSALAANLALLSPHGTLPPSDSAHWLAAGVFVISGALISWIAGAMHRARTSLAEAETQARLAREHEQMDEDLRRYRLLARHSRDVILFVRREDGCILEASAAATRAYGYTHAELQALTIHDLRADHTHGRTELQMAEAEAAGILFEAVHRRKDGSTFPVEVNSQAAVIDGSRGLISVIRDITDRKQAEQALRESEAVLRSLFDSPELMRGIVELVDGKIVHISCNQAAAEMYGVDRNSIMGRSATEAGASEEATRIWVELYTRSWRTGEPVSLEYARRDSRGGERWLLATASYLATEPSGNPRFGYTMLDLTERKRAEEALRESETRLRTLGDNLPEGAIYRYRQDADGNTSVDFISAGIERLTGVPATEFMGDPGAVSRSIEPADRDRLSAAIAVSREEMTRFEVEVRHKHRTSGETRWTLLRSSPTRCPDGSTVWDGIELDITDRKRAEEALRESEVRYRRLVDLAPEALLVQQDGRIVYCNDVASQLYGAKNRDELLNTSVLERVHPDELPAARTRIRNAQQCGGQAVCETRHVRIDGSEVAVETTAGPVEWHGRPALLVFVRDITDRKRAEMLLRDAQKLESLGLLAGGLAHDFNNLLVGVIGNASLAQGMLPPDHAVVPLLEGVLKAGEQAAHLTRQMLAYSGKGRFLVEALDLSEMIPDMIGLVRPSIGRRIALRFDLEPHLPLFEADRGQIQQVFMNLLLNAAEAIGVGEGLITVKTAYQDADERWLSLRPESASLAPGTYVLLEVSDTGCGMDEATQARIFDPFFSTKFIGRGLGLAAVAGIVRGHKGAISVSSVQGQGSRFTVMLPATARTAISERPLTDTGEAPRGGGTILVVDDEQTVRDLLKRSLERIGYTVLLADSGLAAIDVYRRHPGDIALLILDMSMPEMSGEDALPELQKIRPKVGVLVSSGYGESEAMSIFQGQKVSGFIQKPYTLKEIAEKVKACLG